MENTQKVLFEDDSPQWYIAMGDRWLGPIAASDVYERVASRKITWAHFVWKSGEKEWRRLCDVPVFAAAVPQQPSKSLQSEVKESSKEVARLVVKTATGRSDCWFLYYNETQFGPFTQEDVVRFLQAGKITPRVHAWQSGLPTWTRIESLDSFKETLAELKPAAPEKTGFKTKPENRKAPRRPLVAKILLANQREVSEAICRDISVGGMQVLTEQNPGEVGERIKLNVSTACQTSGSPAEPIASFVAEGVIVRFLEDQKGFSFRFERLSEQAKRSIEQYIAGN